MAPFSFELSSYVFDICLFLEPPKASRGGGGGGGDLKCAIYAQTYFLVRLSVILRLNVLLVETAENRLRLKLPFPPPAQRDLLGNEEAPSDLNSTALPVDEAEKPLGEATVDAGVGDHADTLEKTSSPGDPVPMCPDSDGPVHDT